MKKIIIYFISSLMLCGCENFLNRSPLADLSDASYFGSKSDLNAWNAGIYTMLQSTLSRGHLEWGDMRSDLYGSTGNAYVPIKQYLNNLDATVGEYSWENLYRVVMRCNTAIERYPTIPGVSEIDYNDYLGQAYGIRALMYFYAIRVWGDVPIVNAQWDGIPASSFIPRSPVADVKTLILSDIDEALKRLGAGVTGDRKYYFNRAAAYALKTDVHLWFGEDPEALEASEWFFTGANPSAFSLIKSPDDYRTIFTDPVTSTETIFSLYWNTVESGTGCAWCGVVGSKGGTDVSVNNGYKMSDSVFHTFVGRIRSGQGTDARFLANIDTVGIYNSVGVPGNRLAIVETHYTTSGTAAQAFINKNIKYSPKPDGPVPTSGGWFTVLPILASEGGTDGRCQVLVPLYRLADVYTLRAEALNRLGRGAEALSLVNSIRRRVGYLADATTEADPGDKATVEMLIMEERKLEFIAEGRRWFDLRRMGDQKLIEIMDPIIKKRQGELQVEQTGFGAAGKVLGPIHSREFEANPALEQNEPYGGND